MNFRIFEKLLSTKQEVLIEIIKNSQITGHHPENMFLTNRSNHRFATYPLQSNTQTHLHPGDIFKVLEVHKPQTKYGPSCILVENNDHKPFYIFQNDFKRFIKLV